MHNSINRKQKIEGEVQKTIHGLGDLKDINASPNFFAAVQERINKLEADQVPWSYRVLIWYYLAPAILAMFIILNVVRAFFVVSGQDYAAYERQMSIEAVAGEYSISGLGALSKMGSAEEP
jgi:hypothetical protein